MEEYDEESDEEERVAKKVRFATKRQRVQEKKGKRVRFILSLSLPWWVASGPSSQHGLDSALLTLGLDFMSSIWFRLSVNLIYYSLQINQLVVLHSLLTMNLESHPGDAPKEEGKLLFFPFFSPLSLSDNDRRFLERVVG